MGLHLAIRPSPSKRIFALDWYELQHLYCCRRCYRLIQIARSLFPLNYEQVGVQINWINYLQFRFGWSASKSGSTLMVVGFSVALLPQLFMWVSQSCIYGVVLSVARMHLLINKWYIKLLHRTALKTVQTFRPAILVFTSHFNSYTLFLLFCAAISPLFRSSTTQQSAWKNQRHFVRLTLTCRFHNSSRWV